MAGAMIFIIVTTLWLGSTLSLCAFSFWAGRCARKLPILDENLPWTMSRGQAEISTADGEGQRPEPPEPPQWPLSR